MTQPKILNKLQIFYRGFSECNLMSWFTGSIVTTSSMDHFFVAGETGVQ